MSSWQPAPMEWNRADVARLCGRDTEDYSWGVPDLLPYYDGPFCDVQHPEWGCVCTRLPAHAGRHAAANGDGVITAVWVERELVRT